MALDGRRPDREGLFQLASEQRGYFTTAQARSHRYSRALLAHHAKTGTLRRVYTGVYRFRDYPSSPREEVVAAWLAVGKDVAVVSHESALERTRNSARSIASWIGIAACTKSACSAAPI